MALINGVIPRQNFELVRDKIGEILATEFAAQFALTANEELNATVHVERIVPFDHSELPCINVLLSRGDFENMTAKKSDGTYQFNIDVYAKSKSSQNQAADVRASFIMQKMVGMAMAILENPRYRTLSFAAPSIAHTQVSNISIIDPTNNQDAESAMMGRLTFQVRINENVELLTANTIAGYVTNVRLDETDKGYVFTKFP